MTDASAPPPALSVVLVAPSEMATIGRTMQHLRAQTAHRVMEVILVVPSAADLDLEALGRSQFAALRVVEAGAITHRGAAAALGIGQATAAVVGLIEDHSFPEPAWAEALIRAHEGPWTAVGPAVENANPESTWSTANFILTYSDFSGPLPAAERHLLPWHNSAYKRAALEPVGARLGDLLEWEARLQEEIRAAGGTLYFEPAARTHHMNISAFRSTLGLHFQRGRIMAAHRTTTQRFTRWQRILRAAAFPVYPILQLRHFLPAIRRSGTPGSALVRNAPALALALAAMAMGEAAGYLRGLGAAIDRLEDFELHRLAHLSRSDRQMLLQDAGSHSPRAGI